MYTMAIRPMKIFINLTSNQEYANSHDTFPPQLELAKIRNKKRL